MSVFETFRQSRLRCVNAINTFLHFLMAPCKSNRHPATMRRANKCDRETEDTIPLTAFKL